MAGEPALEKVLTALRSTLGSAEQFDGATIEIDRPSDKAYGRGELPAINPRHISTSFSSPTYGETLHSAEVDLDYAVETKAAATIGKRLREMEADLIAVLFANRTLGGLVQDIQPQDSSGGEEQESDTGLRTLTVHILFLTPVGDHRTLVGANGLIP